MNLVLPDGLPIDQVTKQAFSILGTNGIIGSASGHECSDCTHEYKATADRIANTMDDPAALLGVDEDRDVPGLENDDDTQDPTPESPVDVVMENSSEPDHDYSPVKMVVLDGIVMGHTVGYILLFLAIHHSY